MQLLWVLSHAYKHQGLSNYLAYIEEADLIPLVHTLMSKFWDLFSGSAPGA